MNEFHETRKQEFYDFHDHILKWSNVFQRALRSLIILIWSRTKRGLTGQPPRLFTRQSGARLALSHALTALCNHTYVRIYTYMTT